MSKKLILVLLLSLTEAVWSQVAPVSFVQASLPLILNERPLGDIQVRLSGETLKLVEKKTFLEAAKRYLKSEVTEGLELKDDWISPSDFPFEISFNPSEATIKANVPLALESSKKMDVKEDPRTLYKSQALRPAPFGGAINYRVEQAFGAQELGGDAFSTYLDSFVNLHSFVLENQSNYISNDSEHGWFRGDTRLVKDFQNRQVRTEIGDVYPANFGFMPARPLGGIHIARNFTLDPYRVAFPQGQGQFTLRTRSRVRTFVNGVMIKEETLPAGNYDLRDVPLINGLNTVVVEVIDELGDRRRYEFKLPTSVGLLRKDDWNFSFSHGKPFLDSNFKRTYQDGAEITSSFVQHGFTDQFSLGGYAQNQQDFTLTGVETGLSTNFGNLFLGGAAATQESTSGAGSLTWQYQNLGTKLFNAFTFTLRHERFAPGFKTVRESSLASLRSQVLANITVPLQEILTASVGGSWADVRDDELADRKGWDVTLNLRAWRNLNLSFFMSRTRDEFKQWNDVAYVFFTWAFDHSNHLVSGFHDIENRTNRLTAIQDNGNRLYHPRITAIAEDAPTKDTGEIDAFVPTPFADIGGRVATSNVEDEATYARGVARVSSAIVFAYDEGKMGVGLSRPVPNSFVLFKPSRELRSQKVALRSTSPFTEGESGAFGEITFTNLLAYQYREIQLDPSGLDEGTTLEQEKFVVYPTYRSAHLIALKDKGTVVLSGVLVDDKGKPLGLTVGEVSHGPFFTTREGRFFIEGLTPGVHVLKVDGRKASIRIKIPPNARGIRDLGVVKLPREKK